MPCPLSRAIFSSPIVNLESMLRGRCDASAGLMGRRGERTPGGPGGSPIDHFTRKGLGAALSRQPARVARIVGAMVKSSSAPITVKIRLGWNDDKDRNYLEVAHAAVETGAQAVFVHGHTRGALSPRRGVGRDRGTRCGAGQSSAAVIPGMRNRIRQKGFISKDVRDRPAVEPTNACDGPTTSRW